MSRAPTLTVPALSRLDGRLRRLVGSVDARGDGVQFDIPHVGPYLLVAVARGLMGPDLPPFGEHPHSGLVAVSWVPSGGPWRSVCNVADQRHLAFSSGDVLVTLAGRGITHDELTVGDGAHALVQIILRLPASTREVAPRLWRLQPRLLEEGVQRLYDAESLSGTGMDATAYWVDLPAGHGVTLPIAPEHAAGFVFVDGGAVRIADTWVAEDTVSVLSADGDTLQLTAGVEGPAGCFVGLARPFAEPWEKRLGYNGFVVGETVADAEEKLRRFAADPQAFGRLPVS